MNSPEEQIFSEMRRLASDARYQHQVYPAWIFTKYANKYLGTKITSLEENKNDPPDFIIIVDNEKINLEVTRFANETIVQRDSFFNYIESQMELIFNTIRDRVAIGMYKLHSFPGGPAETHTPGFLIDQPDFQNRARKDELSNQLEKIMKYILVDFEPQSSETHKSYEIRNDKNQKIGEIRISKYPSSAIQFFVDKQRMVRLESWSKQALLTEFEKIVRLKESKYLKLNVQQVNPNPWWLLISDVHDDMRTSNSQFDVANLALSSNFFKRIFLLQGISSDYHIYSLKSK